MRPSGRPPTVLSLSLAQLADALGAERLGDGTVVITGAGGLDDAGPGDLVRVDAPRFLAAALASPAAALLVGPDQDPHGRPALRVRDPRVAFARARAVLSGAETARWGGSDSAAGTGRHPGRGLL